MIINYENISFALVVRVQKSETPFINEFLEYYRHLGINKFYLVNTEPTNREFIANEISPEFKDTVQLINKRSKDTLYSCPNIALPKVSETFLLHIDLDEFLYLNGMRLDEFMKVEGLYDSQDKFIEYSFNWVMSPLCNEIYAPSINSILNKKYFFPSKGVKSLALTKNITTISCHKFDLIGQKKIKKYNCKVNNCFIFHVSSRGIFDIINKIQFGQYGNLKQSINPKKELSEFIFDKTSISIPARFILLAFQSRFTDYVIKCNFDYPKLKYKTDTNLLKEITLNSLENLLNKKIIEKDLEKIIIIKMNQLSIHPSLFHLYSKGEISLLNVLNCIIKDSKQQF